MSTQTMPQIPPRPARNQEKTPATSAGSNLLGADMPKIPPRPVNRRIDRSQSPHRESFARSPLNELPSSLEKKSKPSSLYASGSENPSSSDLPHRPSSVVLPSIGQEGSEYSEAFEVPDMLATSPTHRSIANDLKLHAPKPSLPQSSAKQRVSTVTRTDSDQAAALGYGKAGSDHANPSSHSLKSKSSFTSMNSSHDTERRPSSSHGQDEAIPEIGLRVPMYRDAGDVQAPSPQSTSNPFSPGIGFHNDGSKPRHHGRRASGKGFDVPPGSYGLHGHGIIPHDKFERAYYEKHPELLQKECGQYGAAIGDSRGEFVLSSEDLNKLVRETASRGSGLGTSSTAVGTPSEQVGFQASEEYASRMSSPRPQSTSQNKSQSNLLSPTHVDSPLRNESNPADAKAIPASLGRSLKAPSDHALESEYEDEDTIHVEEPSRRISKIYGGAGHMESTESLGRHGETTEDESEYTEEHGYSAPILASDEVAKEPFASWDMQPAVSPHKERKESYDPDSAIHHRSGSASSLSSRPSSIHGGVSGMREAHSTPLENLDEYEPLFPEDDKGRPSTVADRLKRPELKNRKFPSQDIWEDTPNSLQYTATVSTPQLPEDQEDERFVMKNLRVRENETPAQAFARKQEELAESESSDSGSFYNSEKKPWAKATAIPTHLVQETRPSMKQRFPSRDIWEDTPDSLQLETTVSGPQASDADVMNSPDDRTSAGVVGIRPHIPARPVKGKSSESSDDSNKAPPSISERPVQKRSTIPPVFAKPSLPDKSKPTIPARPSKLGRETSQENLTRVTSGGSTKSDADSNASAAASKPKPPVPSRPVGSKIAALQGGFMSDLNKRLQLGPIVPKKEETKPAEEEVTQEKAPLSDARKGRARGPARRAPAKEPEPAIITTTLPIEVAEKLASLGLPVPAIQWSISLKDGSLTIIPQEAAKIAEVEAVKAVEPSTTETASDDVHSIDKGTPEAEKAMPAAPSAEEHLEVSPESFPIEKEEQATSSSPTLVTEKESPLDETASTGTVKPATESMEELRLPKEDEDIPITSEGTVDKIIAGEVGEEAVPKIE